MPPVARVRLAETVASELRERIIAGELTDGDRLPSLDALTAEFGVGLPAVREALRILEHEGLITVQRGNVGGAIVHQPTREAVAYSLSLVLRSTRASALDVVDNLGELEALAAGRCARRGDRAEQVVAPLRDAHRHAERIVEGPGTEFSAAMATFHHLIGACCGSETLGLLIEILTRLWAAQGEAWFATADETKDWPPMELRQRGLDHHARVIDAIDRGDPDDAMAIMRELASHPSHFGPGVTEQPLQRADSPFTGRLRSGRATSHGHLRSRAG